MRVKDILIALPERLFLRILHRLYNPPREEAIVGRLPPAARALAGWKWKTIASWRATTEDERIRDLDFDGRLGVAATSEGRIFISPDTGGRWRKVDTHRLGTTGHFLCTYLVCGDHVIVAGRRHILFSADQGVNWDEAPVMVPEEVMAPWGRSVVHVARQTTASITDLDADPSHPGRVMAVGSWPGKPEGICEFPLGDTVAQHPRRRFRGKLSVLRALSLWWPQPWVS